MRQKRRNDDEAADRANRRNGPNKSCPQCRRKGPGEDGQKAADAPVQTIIATTGTRSLDPVSKYLDQLNPEAKTLISKLALDILMEYPDWSREKIYAEAKKLIPGVYRNP